jgi:hypothetical protein
MLILLASQSYLDVGLDVSGRWVNRGREISKVWVWSLNLGHALG